MKTPENSNNYEIIPTDPYANFLKESKRFKDFTNSLIEKMPSGTFDFKNIEHWRAFIKINNDLYIQKKLDIEKVFSDPSLEISTIEKMKRDRRESLKWTHEHISSVHDDSHDTLLPFLNTGVFEFLKDLDVVKEEHRELFMNSMPEYRSGITAGSNPWNADFENGLPEVKKQYYEEKLNSYQKLAESVGGMEKLEKAMADLGAWMYAIDQWGYFQKTHSDQPWSTLGPEKIEKPSDEFIKEWKTTTGLPPPDHVGYGHTGNHYFGSLEGGFSKHTKPEF